MSTKHVQLFNALVRTHHITSRKKVARLKKAAVTHDCYVLLKSGGCPGIMYCEGDEDDVKQWIATVQVRASKVHEEEGNWNTINQSRTEPTLQGLSSRCKACSRRELEPSN